MQARTRVFMVEDEPLLIEGVKATLGPRFEFVGSAVTGREALQKFADFPSDILLVDLKLPDGNGLEIAKRLQHLCAAKVFVITGRDDVDSLLSVLRAGVDGYLLKVNAFGSDLNRALTAITDGKLFLGDAGADVPAEILSPREREVLLLVAKGLSNHKIGERLGLSARTVEKHREHITHKLGISGELELTKYAIRKRIFNPKFSRRDSPSGEP